MHIFTFTPLSKVHQQSTLDSLEQEITDAEITNMRQEQSITDNEMAIEKLTSKVGSDSTGTKEA